MCGEKSLSILTVAWVQGSPPHVRGKVKQCLLEMSEIGITPACAGKRNTFFNGFGIPGDHPRMCGEKTKKIP